jgi:hypothetical protein
LETTEDEFKANKKIKLTNDESSSQDNQEKSNMDRDDGSEIGEEKVSEKTENKIPKVVTGSIMELPPLRNLYIPDTDMLPEYPNLASLPIDISRVCTKKRTHGPVLVLNLHHGDLVIMEGKAVQNEYEQ